MKGVVDPAVGDYPRMVGIGKRNRRTALQSRSERVRRPVLRSSRSEDWDVDFKLHAPKRTTVEARVRSGKVVELRVEPSDREEDVVIMGRRSK